MNDWRATIKEVLRCMLISSTILMVWKCLILFSNSAKPIVLVLSGGMGPTFYAYGDLLLLTNYPSESVRAGDVIAFRVTSRDIPVVHRVIRVHEKDDGYVKFLTKGDYDFFDDRLLYLPDQRWLEKRDIIGQVKGYFPYMGILIILMNDICGFNYCVLALICFFELINYWKHRSSDSSRRTHKLLDIYVFLTTIRYLVY